MVNNFAPATTFVPYAGPTPIVAINRTTLPLSANPNRNQVYPPPAPEGFTDHIYAMKYGVPLELRIWPANVSDAAPWLFWTHGGGYIAGRHYDPNPWLFPAFQPEGYHVVSASYRLAPQASLEDMYEDAKDAFSWAYAHLPEIVGADKISRDNYFVGGDSAGGTISLYNGHNLNPPPKAVLALYPPGDLEVLGRPRDPLAPRVNPNLTNFSPQQVYTGARSRNLSEAIILNPGSFELTYQSEELTRSLWRAPWISYTNRAYFQGAVESYLGAVAGVLPVIMRYYDLDSTADYTNYTRKLSPLEQVKQRKTYPPTYLMHGFDDRLVNVTESYKFAAALKEIGVPVGEWYEPGSHVFDFKYRNGTASAGWSEFVRPVIDFMNKHVRK